MKSILLNPGPVTLSDGVRAALGRTDLCHREPEFAELQSRLRQRLVDIYDLDPTLWAAVLLTGSGTAAVEAMVLSCIPSDGRLLVVVNGVYGERVSAIAKAAGIVHDCVSVPWGKAPELAAVEQALDAGAFSHVAVVHHETTTGRLNDLDALAEACRRHGAAMLIDGVSSFGAEELAFDRWPVDACAATANKCLHGVPGTAFVITRRAALARAPQPPRSVYLNLAAYLSAQDADGTPFTQSVQTFYALDCALDEFATAGGWRARRQLFRARMSTIRTHLRARGVTPMLGDGETSCVLHAFRLPPGIGYDVLHDHLKTRGFIIYAGQGQLADSAFRISAMGDISGDDIARLLTAFDEVLV